MELNPGICGICSSKQEVLKAEDCNNLWEVICQILKEEVDSFADLKSTLKICAICIFQLTLIEERNTFLTADIIEQPVSLDNCAFCKDDTKLLKVKKSRISKKFELLKRVKEKGCLIICASCYYVIEAIYMLKEKLASKVSDMKKLSSGEFSSDSHHSKSTKRIKLSSGTRFENDPLALMSIADNSDDEHDKESVEIIPLDVSERDSEKENEESENLVISSSKLRKRKFHNGETSSHSQVVHEENDMEGCTIISESEQVTPSRKSTRRRITKDQEEGSKVEIKEKAIEKCLMTNSSIEDSNLISAEAKRKSGKDLRSKLRGASSDYPDGKSEPSPVTDRRTTSRNISRKRKASKSPEVEVPKQKKSKVFTNTWHIDRTEDLDLSKIMHFTPLFKSEIVVDEEVKQDPKFYRKIPFVRVRSISEITNSDTVAEIDDNSARLNFPTGLTKRTPPIKIKLKVGKKLTKQKKHKFEMKISKRHLPRKESVSPDLIEEIKKKKVVVKVSRIKLPIKMETESNEEDSNQELNGSIDGSLTEKVADISQDATPKKKKRVHFNDTPTIIITESDNFDSTNEEDEIPTRKRSVRNGRTFEVNEMREEHESCEESNKDNEKTQNDKDTTEEENLENERNNEETDEGNEETAQENEESEFSEISKNVEEDEDTEVEEGMTHEKIELMESCTSAEKSNELKNEENYSLEKTNEIDEKNEQNEESKESQEDVDNSENNEDTVDKTSESIQNDEENMAETSNTVNEISEETNKDNEITHKETQDDLGLEEETVDENSEKEIDDESDKDTIDISAKSREEEAALDADKEQCLEECEAEEVVKEKIILSSDVIVSEENEDFGSLIDEVQKCLTSSKDLSIESTEDITLELHATNEEIDEFVSEKDTVESCLKNGDEILNIPVTENIIDEDKATSLKATCIEDASSEKSPEKV